jgi:FMN phosphatase YigB (HAD superfamily)
VTVRALVFDVFGTLVDWRSGVAREAARLLAPLAPDLDAGAFAVAVAAGSRADVGELEGRHGLRRVGWYHGSLLSIEQASTRESASAFPAR